MTALGIVLVAAVTAVHPEADSQGRFTHTLVIEVVSPGEAIGKLAVHVSARRSAYLGAGEASPLDVETSTGTAALPLSAGTWVLQASAPGYWSPSEIITVPEHERDLRLRLWPTGGLKGSWSGGDVPATLTARFRPPASGSERRGSAAPAIPEDQVDCTLIQTHWLCYLPAGVLDVELRARSFVPIYLWNVAIPAGQEVDLGARALRSGASVAGFAQRPDGGPAPTDSRVHLTSHDGRPLEGPAAPAVAVDERGFFQIAGVLPADYLLQARGRPGRAAAPVRVLAGVEARLAAPLVLRPPLSLRVDIAPPTDPWGAPWQLRLAGPLVPRSELAPQSASKDGLWRRDDLIPGRYVLMVESGRDGSRWYGEEIAVDEGTSPFRVDLSLVSVRGGVTLGGEPLPKARLSFGGEHGLESISLETDEDGRFTGSLPRAGEWELGVRAEEPLVARTLTVEVSASQDLDIALPDTAIVGTVVDEEGRPQPAMVTASSLDQPVEPPVQAPSKADGTFRLSGLAPGRQLLVAQAMESAAESDEVVAIARESKPAEVRLVVRAQRNVEGQVVANGLGVPGAELKVAPAQSRLWMAQVLRADAQGRFKLILPAGTTAVDVSTSALGFGYRMQRAALPAQGPLVLSLERAAGTLLLEWPPGTGLSVRVLHAGTFDHIVYLSRWAMANNGSRSDTGAVVPQLEPGPYTACRTDGLQVPGGPESWPADRCVSGTLVAGGELRLAVPGPSWAGP